MRTQLGVVSYTANVTKRPMRLAVAVQNSKSDCVRNVYPVSISGSNHEQFPCYRASTYTNIRLGGLVTCLSYIAGFPEACSVSFRNHYHSTIPYSGYFDDQVWLDAVDSSRRHVMHVHQKRGFPTLILRKHSLTRSHGTWDTHFTSVCCRLVVKTI